MLTFDESFVLHRVERRRARRDAPEGVFHDDNESRPGLVGVLIQEGSAEIKKAREGKSGPLRAAHVSRHKWPGGLIN